MAMHADDQSRTVAVSSNDDAPLTSKTSTTWFEIPPAVKRIFDQYPLLTYAANGLPLRAPKSREQHVLHVFTTAEEAVAGRPSFNPSCLKWQTYLKIAGVPFKIQTSNNHASPSGALPFLIPAALQVAVPSNKLRKWCRSTDSVTTTKIEEPDDARYEAYASLLEGSVRKAWLYQLYLNPANRPLLHTLYITPCSVNPLVQLTISLGLRCAASAELVKACCTTTLVETDILREAQEAFSALSELLGEDRWFFGNAMASLFDAGVFAYTHLLLDGSLPWAENKMGEELGAFENLVQHARRVDEMYYAQEK